MVSAFLPVAALGLLSFGDSQSCLPLPIFDPGIRHNITDLVRFNERQRRGGGNVRGDSVFDHSGAGFDQLSDQQAHAADVLMDMNERCDKLLARLPSDNLRKIASLRLHGHSNEEIARQLEVSPRTIERKLSLIRQNWTP